MGGAAEAAVPVGQHPPGSALAYKGTETLAAGESACQTRGSCLFFLDIALFAQCDWQLMTGLLPVFSQSPLAAMPPAARFPAHTGLPHRSTGCPNRGGRPVRLVLLRIWARCRLAAARPFSIMPSRQKRPAQGLRVQNGRAWAGAASAVKRLEWGSEFL